MSSQQMTRRRFFDLAGGAAAGSVLLTRGLQGQRTGRGPNDRVRIALIGSGNRGRQVDRAVGALRAYKASNRVVQFGTQQRSGSHFQEAAKIIQDGQLGG